MVFGRGAIVEVAAMTGGTTGGSGVLSSLVASFSRRSITLVTGFFFCVTFLLSALEFLFFDVSSGSTSSSSPSLGVVLLFCCAAAIRLPLLAGVGCASGSRFPEKL